MKETANYAFGQHSRSANDQLNNKIEHSGTLLQIQCSIRFA